MEIIMCQADSLVKTPLFTDVTERSNKEQYLDSVRPTETRDQALDPWRRSVGCERSPGQREAAVPCKALYTGESG